jgi:hypothetical protein
MRERMVGSMAFCRTEPDGFRPRDVEVLEAIARIEEALAAAGGRVSGAGGAAARLGVPATTLESRIKSLKIDKRQFR